MFCSFFFFFKQKTAYEMRISDWSSDVCSSDLATGKLGMRAVEEEVRAAWIAEGLVGGGREPLAKFLRRFRRQNPALPHVLGALDMAEGSPIEIVAATRPLGDRHSVDHRRCEPGLGLVLERVFRGNSDVPPPAFLREIGRVHV